MDKLSIAIEENRASKTDFHALLPNLYGGGVTRWNVKWSKNSEGVDISYEILPRLDTYKRTKDAPRLDIFKI